MCKVDKHAEVRVRKRNGINKKAVNNSVTRAQRFGKSINEIHGRLHTYLELKQDKYNNVYDGRQYCRIYGNTIYWFLDDVNGDKLITATTIRHSTTRYNKAQYGF